jgi:hypothetical protein
MSEGTTTTTTKKRISRRKFGVAVKMLKQAIATPTLSWQTRLRAVELLMSLYDVPLPDSSRRDRKSVRQLVTERAGERSLHQHIKDEVAEQVRAEAEQQAQDDIDTALKAFLGTDRAETVDAN